MKIEKIQLENDETILAQVRKHWFVLTVQIAGLVGAGLMPALLYILIMSADIPGLTTFAFTFGILFTLYSAWLLIVWMGLFNVWNNYYLDVWTITNKRLITIDQRGFFSRTTASFRFERLQDMEIQVNGIIATFLNFGSLEIQTAGEEGNFKGYSLPKPDELKALILSAADHTAPTVSNTSGM